MTEHDRINRSNSLRQLRENEHYADVVTAVRNRLETEWQSSKPDDVARRERVFLSLRLLDTLTRLVEQHIETGEVDRKRIDEINGRKKLLSFDLW